MFDLLASIVVCAAPPALPARTALAAPAALAAPQGERITPSLLASDWADVAYYAVSPDGSRVVYLADQPEHPADFTSPPQIFSVPTDRSAEPVRLNGPLVAGGNIRFVDGVPFRITGDSSRVVYIADQDVDVQFDLFSAPIDGSGPAVRLHPSHPGDDVAEFELGGDGSQVVFRADHATDSLFDLFLVPADGTSAPTQLTSLSTAGSDITEFELDPTGSHVVYLADLSVDFTYELWSSPTSGLLTATRLSGPLPHNSADIGGGFFLEGPAFRITPDGASVFYVGEQTTLGVRELFRAPIATPGAFVNVSETLAANGDVLRFDLTPDGNHVVFRADKDADQVDELYTRPTDLSTGVVRLNDGLVAGGDVYDYVISPDSSRVVYRADQNTDEVFELFSVPAAGGTAELLNDALPAGGDVHPTFAVTPSSTRVVFRAEGELDDRIELYGVAIDGSAGMARLSPDLPGDVEEQWSLTANGLAVAFVLDHDSEPRQLFAGATTPNVTPVRLDPGTVFFPGVGLDPRVTSGNVVVYTSEQDAEDALEIFGVPILGGAATKLNASFAKLALGDVVEFALTPAGDGVVYLADADRPDSFEVYVLPVDGSAAPVRVSAPTPAQEVTASGPLRISPDGTRVAYFYGIDPLDPLLDSEFELYSAPLDGSSPQVRLNQDLGADESLRNEMDFTPDSSRVLFHVFSTADATNDFWSVPADGSAAATLLADLSPPGGFVLDWVVTPDDLTVVYRAEQEVDDRFDLHRVPVDGSAPPVRLSEFQYPTGGDVGQWFLTPDGQTVVFRANQEALARDEVYSRPVDGSAPATILSVHTNADHFVQSSLDLSADGTVVAYAADGETPGVLEVYRVPVDASALPLRLSGPLVAGGGAWLPQIDSTQSRVVFRGDVEVDQRFELFSVPLDGSSLPTRLNDPIGGGSDVEIRFTLSPDGARVVFRMDRDLNNQIELYSAPIDGSAPAVELNQPLADPASDVADFFQLTPDGSQVVYFADPLPGVEEIFSVPIDGARRPRRLNRRLGAGQDVHSFSITPAGASVVYHADQDTVDVDELFRSSLGPRIRPAAEPTRSTVLQR